MTHAVSTTHDGLLQIARKAMIDRGLRPDFSAAAQAEADATRPATALAHVGPRDLRDLPWCSIDNDDSRDLDQLTAAQALPGGAAKLLVAIADVEVLVAPGSAIDEHAGANTTSVYTAAGVFPMLPLRLSTDLSSLNEGEDRLAIVVEIVIEPDGSERSDAIHHAWVRSRAKLAYPGIAAWLEGAPPPPKLAAVPGLDDQLRLQDRMAQALQSAHQRAGALDLSTPTARPVFANGIVADLQPDDRNRAKELIATFMIAANSATARFLQRRGFPSIRRLLRAPRRWERIVEIARGVGERLSDAPSAPALQGFLARRRAADPAGYGELSLSVVKLLGSGEYVAARPGERGEGHFGLAVSDYTHSTAPNRRFPDLVTQRLIKAALAGEPAPYGNDELDVLARHCTLQEDNAGKVERQVRKCAAAVLLAGRIGDTFTAIVTGAAPKGTWVRVGDPMIEGRLVEGEEGVDVGDRVRVQLVRVDATRGFIDFRRTP